MSNDTKVEPPYTEPYGGERSTSQLMASLLLIMNVKGRMEESNLPFLFE